MLAPSRSGRRAARPLANSAYAEKSVAISTVPSGRRRPVTTMALSGLSSVSRRARSKRRIEHEQLADVSRRDQPDQTPLVEDDERGTIAVLHASERDVGQLRRQGGLEAPVHDFMDSNLRTTLGECLQHIGVRDDADDLGAVDDREVLLKTG